MGTKFRRILAACAVGTLTVALLAAPAQADDPGTVTGRITNVAGAPVLFAELLLTEVNQTFSAFAVSDADGRYTFSNVPAGQYKLSVFIFPTGFQWAHGKDTEETADVFTVTPGGTTVIDEQQLPPGTIEVTVTDAVTGEPIETACIFVPTGNPTQPSTCANVDGVYTLGDIQPGTHVVTVATSTHGNADRTVEVTRGEVTRLAVALQPPTSFSFTVVDHRTNAPVSGVCVEITEVADPGLFEPEGRHCTNSAGQVTLSGFLAGTYQVFAHDPSVRFGAQWLGPHGGTGRQEQALAIVGPAGQNTVVPTIRMQRPRSITGVVRDAATGAPLADVCAHPFAFDSAHGYGGGPNCTDPTGRYTINALGPYQWPVLFTPQDSSYAWIWSGGQPNRFAAFYVQLATGGTVRTLNAALFPGGTITGRALDTAGLPKGATIVPRNAVTGDLAGVRSGPDSSTGVYQLVGLYTQQIKIQYFMSSTGSCWYRLKTSFAAANPVRVRSGQTTTGIDLVDCGA